MSSPSVSESDMSASLAFATLLACAGVSSLKPFGIAGPASAFPTGTATVFASARGKPLRLLGKATAHWLSSLRLLLVVAATVAIFADLYLGTPQYFSDVSGHVYLCCLDMCSTRKNTTR